MKFDMNAAPPLMPIYPEVGDVYAAKGGRKGRFFWVVVAKSDRMLYCLGLSEQGEIISAGSYGDHCFSTRERLGVVEDMRDLNLEVQWGV